MQTSLTNVKEGQKACVHLCTPFIAALKIFEYLWIKTTSTEYWTEDAEICRTIPNSAPWAPGGSSILVVFTEAITSAWNIWDFLAGRKLQCARPVGSWAPWSQLELVRYMHQKHWETRVIVCYCSFLNPLRNHTSASKIPWNPLCLMVKSAWNQHFPMVFLRFSPATNGRV